MKGVERLYQKRPRWQVQYLRDGGPGEPRWMDERDAQFYCYSEAFRKVLGEGHPNRWRVWDRQLKLEVIWPGHDFRLHDGAIGTAEVDLSKPIPDHWSDSMSYMLNGMAGKGPRSGKSVVRTRVGAT